MTPYSDTHPHSHCLIQNRLILSSNWTIIHPHLVEYKRDCPPPNPINFRFQFARKMIKSISVVVALVALLGFASAKPASFDAQGRRIVNGTATTIETIPFQVSILFFNSQWCGGAVLDETTILTAAHCFDNYFNNLYQLSSWSIRAGSSYWANGGQLVQLQSVVRHEQYNPNTYDFDVAIIKLASPLTFDTTVQPVVLAPANGVLYGGQSIQVSGWGRLVVR